jgi:hypothetical protein
VTGGNHCQATNLKVSAADPDWVYAAVGLYTSAGELNGDIASVVFNLSTHQLIGPTNVGFCAEGNPNHTPVSGYSSLPKAVLAGMGLRPCSSPTSSTAPASGPYAVLAGTWGAHEMKLVISPSGAGQLGYQDLTLCPSCSFATAPPGSLNFVLTSISGHTAQGYVTASSDPKNYTDGQPVIITLAAGSPGELLKIIVGGRALIDFCNSSSPGQCGA